MLNSKFLEAARLRNVDGEYSGQLLSPHLIRSKGLTLEDVETLVDLHLIKEMIYRDIEETINEDELWNLGMLLEGVEFGMQQAWKFPLSANHHTHWLLAPKCECPKMDNNEWWGHRRIVSGACPLHFNTKYYAEMQKEINDEKLT